MNIHSASFPVLLPPHNLEEIIETLSFLDDWEGRYGYLIDLGKALPEMPAELKIDSHRVEGCVSHVWMVPIYSDAGGFDFWADSDSHIVKGLIAVLRAVYAGKSKGQDSNRLREKLETMHLEEHLSPNRRNGFISMVARIETLMKMQN